MKPSECNSHKFGFIIFAKDESSVIYDSIRSIQSGMQTGDDLFVIADNCLDNTAVIASHAGAKLFIRNQKNSMGKGAALKWFIQNYWDLLSDYYYLIILDADSLISDHFSERLEAGLRPDILAAQCTLTPIHYDTSPLGSLIALSGIIEQTIFDRIRSFFGSSVRLCGTGMVFKPWLLKDICSVINTEVEDIAISLLLAEKNIRVYCIPSSVVFDPKPTQISAASRQRARWFRGQWSAFWIYRKKIMNIFFGNLNGMSLIGSLFLKPRWLKLILLLGLGFSFLHFPYLAGAFFTLVSLEILLIFIGICLLPDRIKYFKALLFLPVFILMWMKGILLSFHHFPWLRVRVPSPADEPGIIHPDHIEDLV
jgi:cellulose synthase/poly-beta-1,6-N-acetylglucosamine synthase-like glycosyltransferase